MNEIDHDVYVHSSKESLYDEAARLGLTGEAARMFSFLAYEVKLTYRVDLETGKGVLIFVDGRPIG